MHTPSEVLKVKLLHAYVHVCVCVVFFSGERMLCSCFIFCFPWLQQLENFVNLNVGYVDIFANFVFSPNSY